MTILVYMLPPYFLEPSIGYQTKMELQQLESSKKVLVAKHICTESGK